MSREPFIRGQVGRYRWTDKILYVTWTAPTTRAGVFTGTSTGRVAFRVARDLYDMDDIGEVQERIRIEGYPPDPSVQFGAVALTWWALLELTQSDRDETPVENR